MPERSYRIFISYSRANADMKRRLLVHLSTLKAEGLVSVWDDGCIEAGQLWREELDKAIREADVVLFLVSAEFLASPFCQDVEVPELLKRHREEGVLIIPVIVDYCAWEGIEWLGKFQVLPRDGKPVPARRRQSMAWTEVIRGLRQRLLANPPKTKTRRAEHDPAQAGKPAPLSLPKLLEVMPGESGELFGREDALGWLDSAYEDPRVGVLALVGFGGVGKSALVRHWLETRFEPTASAPRFLGVSFYSQGTREHGGSASQFLVQALGALGETDVSEKQSRGERLADLVAAEPTVLVLDGLEPLQYGPGPRSLEGRLHDSDVRDLLLNLASRPGRSLCVVSTRVTLTDEGLQAPSCVQRSVDVLAREDAWQVLASRGVRGSEAELKEAAESLGCHPLALVLAAEYLHTFAEGQVERLREVDLLSEETREGRHARSVMAAYETALRRDGAPLDLELLGIMGLFDRPTRWHWLQWLAAKPLIRGVTRHLAAADSRELWESISRLRQWGMLAPPESLEKPELDTHPLIREYFGQMLRRRNPAGWRAAHRRMFDGIVKVMYEKHRRQSLVEAISQAMVHGCAAGSYRDALKLYDHNLVGALRYSDVEMFLGMDIKSSDRAALVAALSGFFDKPWERPVSSLPKKDAEWVTDEAAYLLESVGRPLEAAQAFGAWVDAMAPRVKWKNAFELRGFIGAADHLTELYLIGGDVVQAVASASKAVEFANRSDDDNWRIITRSSQAEVLYRAGRIAEAQAAIREAERIKAEMEPEFPKLHFFPGYRYCSLLLHQGRFKEVLARTIWVLRWPKKFRRPNEIVFTYLSLAQAHTQRAEREGVGRNLRHAKKFIWRAAYFLMGYPVMHFQVLAARAECYRVGGNFQRALIVLNEAMEVATSAGMRLFQADCHLGYARLHLALRDKEQAREHLVKAREMIERMGYHLRDEALKELEAELKKA
jgi:tetratricopeptide (TPR) repeat protein